MTKNRWILLGLWSMVWLGCDTALADEMKRVASELEGIPEVSIWTDLSVRFLSQIFGQVVYLPGFDANHPLLSALFWAFNIGVLGLLAVRIGWNIITQTLLASTAGDQISTKIKPMTTIRSLGGILLLLPGSSGYSMVQVLMLTIVVQGVGLATSCGLLVWISLRATMVNLLSPSIQANKMAALIPTNRNLMISDLW